MHGAHPMLVENEIGWEGGVAIGDGLKENLGLSSLNLYRKCKQYLVV